MRVINKIAAFILGSVFFLSGVLKLMDPLGTSLIVSSYLSFLYLGFLQFASGLLACIFPLVECILGSAMILGVFRKPTGIAVLALQVFFTLLTLLLVIFNPQMDCGCFGEAIHLTHTQSFIKNLILLALWALAFLPLRKETPAPRKSKFIGFALVGVSVLLFLLYSSLSLPLIDFTPLKSGVELYTETEFDGEDFDFAAIESPTGEEISVMDSQGEYADSVLTEGKVLAISVYELGKVKPKTWQKISSLVSEASSLGYSPVLLLSSSVAQAQSAVSDNLLGISYFCDKKTLMTLNRSNAGVSYISDGLITAKWSRHSLPDSQDLESIAAEDAADVILSRSQPASLKLQCFLLYIFAVMLLL